MKDNWREKPSEELINACDKRIDPLREATYRLHGACKSVELGEWDTARENLIQTKWWINRAQESIPFYGEQAAIFTKHVGELEPLVDSPLKFGERMEQLEIMPRMIDAYMDDFVSCLCGH